MSKHLTGISNVGRSFAGIANGNGQFVVVSGQGIILSSPDGAIWTRCVCGTTDNFAAITFANGQFVAVGSNFNRQIFTSPDGIIWTAQNINSYTAMKGITYGNGQFVSITNGGWFTSPDAITWTEHFWESGVQPYLSAVAFGNGLYVAVGSSPTPILTSPDSVTWTAQSPTLLGGFSSFYAITYAKGLFVATGNSGIICTSPDGLDRQSASLFDHYVRGSYSHRADCRLRPYRVNSSRLNWKRTRYGNTQTHKPW